MIPEPEPKTIRFGCVDVDTNFTGRSPELLRLKDACTNPPNIVVVSGLGGIGKTQFVLKYADQNRSVYKSVLFINSEESKLVVEAYQTIAKKLKIRTEDFNGRNNAFSSTVEEVLGEVCKLSTLIVFDNVDKKESYDFVQFVIKLGGTLRCRPHIVLTSRYQAWSDSIPLIKLGAFNTDDALEYISKTVIGSGNVYDDSIEDRTTLVQELHCFPLALRQATAHINYQRKQGTFRIYDYVARYRSSKKEILDSKAFKKDLLNAYEETTLTTWRVTITAIQKCGTSGVIANKILRIIAYFHSDNIRRDIFFNLKLPLSVAYKWRLTTHPTATILRLIAYFDPDAIRRDIFFNVKFPFRLDKLNVENEVVAAVRLLVNYSMVDGNEGQDVLIIHRLVQEVIRIEIGHVPGLTKEILRDALSLVLKMEGHPKFNEIHEHRMSVFLSASEFPDLVEQFRSSYELLA